MVISLKPVNVFFFLFKKVYAIGHFIFVCTRPLAPDHAPDHWKTEKNGCQNGSNSELLCILTSFWVLRTPESWLKYFFSGLNLFCSFQMFFSDFSSENKKKVWKNTVSSYSERSTDERQIRGTPSGSQLAYECQPALKSSLKTVFQTFI